MSPWRSAVATADKFCHVFAGRGGYAYAAQTTGNASNPGDVDYIAHLRRPERASYGNGGDQRCGEADYIFKAIPGSVTSDRFGVHKILVDLFRSS